MSQDPPVENEEVVPAISPGAPVTLLVDGEPVAAHLGQSIATALLLAGRTTLRNTRGRGDPRGLFCGMGVCFDCVVTVDDRPGIRACVTPVADGMRVELVARREVVR